MMAMQIVANFLRMKVVFLMLVGPFINSREKEFIVTRKPVFGFSNQVRHKPGCTATEDGWSLKFFNLESRGIVPSM